MKNKSPSLKKKANIIKENREKTHQMLKVKVNMDMRAKRKIKKKIVIKLHLCR